MVGGPGYFFKINGQLKVLEVCSSATSNRVLFACFKKSFTSVKLMEEAYNFIQEKDGVELDEDGLKKYLDHLKIKEDIITEDLKPFLNSVNSVVIVGKKEKRKEREMLACFGAGNEIMGFEVSEETEQLVYDLAVKEGKLLVNYYRDAYLWIREQGVRNLTEDLLLQFLHKNKKI